jgi:hypothetical protein
MKERFSIAAIVELANLTGSYENQGKPFRKVGPVKT